MAEIWKDVKGFPGYQVSNQGRVRSHNKTTYTERHGIRRWKDRIIKQKSQRNGARCICLWADGRGKTVLVHRLVAAAFCPGGGLYSKLTVNHIDGDRSNNSAANLEWMTREENIKYGFDNSQYPTMKCRLRDSNGVEYSFRSISMACSFLQRYHGYINSKCRPGDTFFDANGEPYELIHISKR